MLSDRNKGVEVIMAYCQRALPSCLNNVYGNTGICKVCGHMHRQIISNYLSDIQVIPVSSRQFQKSQVKFDYDDIFDLKKITYRKVHIGLSLLSYFVTITRQPTGKVTAAQRQYFDQILSSLCAFVDYAYHLVEEVNPDVISIYNGRLYENRLFYDIAMEKGIQFESLEVWWRLNEPAARVEYEGDLPLGIRQLTRMANELWDQSPRSEEEKVKIGSSFYLYRRSGKSTNDFVYIGKQVKDMLPEGFDETKRNIVFFNSSEDEIVSLGGDWDTENLFESQVEAVQFIVNHLPENAHLYLRIHPNLKGVTAAYHTDLYKIKSSQLTIIPPESPIGSYALMEKADKILVMGSTIGAESCYWGKPVINLHKCEYFYLNVGYNPQTREELEQLLAAHLEAKPQDGALRYGYYYMAIDERMKTDDEVYFNWKTYSVLGKKVTGVVEYLKLFGSSLLFRLCYPRFVAYFSRFFKNSVSFPA